MKEILLGSVTVLILVLTVISVDSHIIEREAMIKDYEIAEIKNKNEYEKRMSYYDHTELNTTTDENITKGSK
ncbi:MAG: hypothetical protein RBT59_12050 [Arcobacteraceae bacterium]|nr:hypothetical protein [Arcobacteraceae bacterium]